MMALSPRTLDIVFSTPDQQPPDHAGPVGRIKRLVNAIATKYVPAAPGVAQKILIDQRNGFESLTQVTNDVANGEPELNPDWHDPTLLESLGDRLLSVANQRPRVFNGSTWGIYPNNRVVAQKLSQRVVHTANHQAAAPDAAHLNGVTCTVWQEFNPTTSAWDSYVNFVADDGAIVTVPRKIYAASTDDPGLARVVTDGSVFWVVIPKDGFSQNLTIQVYTPDGRLRDSEDLARTWDISPGYWDLAPCSVEFDSLSWTAAIVQPAAFTGDGADVHVQLSFLRWNGTAIFVESVTDSAAACRGPVAFLRNSTADFTDRIYVATAGPSEAVGDIHVYEYTSGVQTQDYAICQTSSLPDSMTGFVDNDLTVHIAISLLASGIDPDAGPQNDPALRMIQIWNCERGEAADLFKEEISLIAQSRAFPVGDNHFLAAYYQSGAGLSQGPTFEDVTLDAADYMFGAPVQDVEILPSDYTTGSTVSIVPTGGFFVVSQAIASITHNAGDSVVAGTRTWTFLNATFQADAIFSILNISGSAISTNNTSYRIVGVPTTTTIITELVGANGAAITSENLAGVTASLTKKINIRIPTSFLNSNIPQDTWVGGNVVVTGSIVPGNNQTYTSEGVLQRWVFPAFPNDQWTVILLPFQGSPTTAEFTDTALVTIDPSPMNLWYTSHGHFDDSTDGQLLRAAGFQTGNVGDFEITDNGTLPGGFGVPFTENQPGQVAQLFSETMIPGLTKLQVVLKNSSTAYKFHFENVDFTDEYLNGYIIVNGMDIAANNGTYTIVDLVNSHTVIAKPSSGSTGQINRDFAGTETVKIQIPITSKLPTQPTWFLVDFDSPQPISGEWETGIAYADWRFDGTSDPTKWPNQFVMELASVVVDDTGASMVLPYRAQSFTAGQVFDGGVQVAQQNTVGLKRFIIEPRPGQAIPAQNALLLPGPLATAYSDSGFAENGISLGFEKPFLIEKTTSSDPLTLTPGVTYEYVIVAELTDENGDRTLSKPSPLLSVALEGTENSIKIGGRLIMPTNHSLIAICIYRNAIIDGIPTVEHYKITNDLDPNGAGFTFEAVAGGITNDTWFYVDTKPDAAIVSSEVLYTDRGLLPRFPCPPFHNGVSNFRQRTWVRAYDGGIWVSGEKTEGDAIWFHPLLRIPTPTADEATAIAILDDYLVVGCEGSLRYLAPGQLPDATGGNGVLPPLLDIPFPNGCTGIMKTVRAGVAYGSTAGGVWILTRSLANEWLSQPLQNDLRDVLSMAIDGKQRLYVADGTSSVHMFDMVSLIWSRFDLPDDTSLVTEWTGKAVNQDSFFVNVQGFRYADIRGINTSGIRMLASLAPISFGNVRGWKRLWEMQLVGTYRGPHLLTVKIAEPDEQSGTEVNPDGPRFSTDFSFLPSATKPYVYAFNPGNEEAGSFEITLSTSFPTGVTPGRAATWELITAEIGLQSGIGRLPPTSRIPKTG